MIKFLDKKQLGGEHKLFKLLIPPYVHHYGDIKTGT